jgi:hypothetical protein
MAKSGSEKKCTKYLCERRRYTPLLKDGTETGTTCKAHWYTCCISSCFQKVYHGDDGTSIFCAKHRCESANCNSFKELGQPFCERHACGMVSCKRPGADHDVRLYLCNAHRCLATGCGYLAGRFVRYRAKDMSRSPYCSSHACSWKSCQRPARYSCYKYHKQVCAECPWPDLPSDAVVRVTYFSNESLHALIAIESGKQNAKLYRNYRNSRGVTVHRK